MAGAARSEPNGAAVSRPKVSGDLDDLDAYFASFEVGVDPFHRAERVPVIASHAEATLYSVQALAHRIRGPEAEVGDDLPVDFQVPDSHGGLRWERLHPDVFVSFGVAHDPTRREYDAEKLGAPDFVLGVLSQSTWQRDMGRKREVYAAMGVREYFVFDPTGDLPVVPPIQGFALARGGGRLPETVLPNGARAVPSEVLGLVAYVSGARVAPTDDRAAGVLSLRWHDPETGTDMPTYGEQAATRAAAESRAEAAEARAEAVERERQELLALVRRLRGEPEP